MFFGVFWGGSVDEKSKQQEGDNQEHVGSGGLSENFTEVVHSDLLLSDTHNKTPNHPADKFVKNAANTSIPEL